MQSHEAPSTRHRHHPSAPDQHTMKAVIPLRDVIPTRHTPWMTWLLLIANGVVYYLMPRPDTAAYEAFIGQFGLTPAFFTWSSLLTSMFVHGGLMHLIGNMLFLWIFGDNVEDRLGHVMFLLFYLACGAAAAFAQMAVYPGSHVPMVGASGAISGVLGAYFVMYPHSRVVTLIPLFIFFEIVELPAIVFLGVWFAYQLLLGLGSLAQSGAAEIGGVAFWAHAGGFVTGLVGALFFRARGVQPVPARSAPRVVRLR
jgi:membrane associated rhomboid family serine protease